MKWIGAAIALLLGNTRLAQALPTPGTIVTVAGFNFGDGGPAIEAPLNLPYGIAVDGAGDVFIADSEHGRIRKLFGVGVSATPPVSGDLDGDGKVDIADATLALRYVVGLRTLSTDQLTVADLNGDGKVTLADVVRLLSRAVGL